MPGVKSVGQGALVEKKYKKTPHIQDPFIVISTKSVENVQNTQNFGFFFWLFVHNYKFCNRCYNTVEKKN